MIKRFTLAVLAVAVLMFGAATQAFAEGIVAVNTQNNLVTFDSATPGTVSTTAITGLRSGESIVGIDYRPANGVIYALGTQGGLYTINQSTGAATFLRVLTADPTDTTAPFTGLNGNAFGFDFNPVPDRLRVVSDAEQNLRINVDTGGTITDTNLAFAGGAGNPNITGSAYSNNVAGATTTTLYGIDTVTNALYIQNPPNDGTLVSVGSLGVDPTSDLHGFDISGATGIAYAAFTIAGQPFSQLYSINLATGLATLIGSIGGGASTTSLTVIPTAVPEPTTMILLGTGLAGVAAKVRKRRKANASDEA